jgi:hypothetical protein
MHSKSESNYVTGVANVRFRFQVYLLYYDQFQKSDGCSLDIADAISPTGYPEEGVQTIE